MIDHFHYASQKAHLWLKSSVFHKTSIFAASQVLLGPKILGPSEVLLEKAINREWGGGFNLNGQMQLKIQKLKVDGPSLGLLNKAKCKCIASWQQHNNSNVMQTRTDTKRLTNRN